MLDEGLWKQLPRVYSKVLLEDEVVERTYDFCPLTMTFRLLWGGGGGSDWRR